MADYIYMMESRLTPEQQKAVGLVQEAARAHEMNLYLSGGTVRDIISGFAIRDLDFTVEGHPHKLLKHVEKSGAVLQGEDENFQEILLQLPGQVRAGINMARSEKYHKPGKPPEISPAAIVDDLRRRDFTINAMALSLNSGSRGLLLDPGNGVADIEAKLIRILHNYSFLDDPSRLMRATRFQARFHWTLEERTQARYNAAQENGYIEHVTERGQGQEIEQLAYEDEPLQIVRALEKEGWMKVLHPHWSAAKVDASGLAQLLKTRQQLAEAGYPANVATAVFHFLTARLSEHDVKEIQRHIPHKGFVKACNNLEAEAKELSHRLAGKEAATPSRAWQLLTRSRPETIAFVEVTARQQIVVQKIRNFMGKWRLVKQRFPLPEMAELRITPALPEYNKLVEQMFYLMLDGKLRSIPEIQKYLAPYSPPLPPPPALPVKRSRGGKAETKAVEAPASQAKVDKGKKKKPSAALTGVAPAAHSEEIKPVAAKVVVGKPAVKKAAPSAKRKPATKAKPVRKAKPASRKMRAKVSHKAGKKKAKPQKSKKKRK